MNLEGLPTPPFKPERVYRGLPVPYTIPWPEGAEKPDFTALDPERHMRALNNNLCGICGKRFTTGLRVWIAGYHDPLPAEGWFIDPPMHEACARYSARVCPYLLHARVREDTPEDTMPDEAPKALYIGRGVERVTYHTRPRQMLRVEKIEVP